MVQEEGWRLAWGEQGEVVAIPPQRGLGRLLRPFQPACRDG